MAVELAKLSLWLVTLARGRPFGFLDHNLRCGDSLIGLTREQIASFTWESGAQQRALRSYLDEVTSRVVSQVIHADVSEAAELDEPKQLPLDVERVPPPTPSSTAEPDAPVSASDGRPDTGKKKKKKRKR